MLEMSSSKIFTEGVTIKELGRIPLNYSQSNFSKLKFDHPLAYLKPLQFLIALKNKSRFWALETLHDPIALSSLPSLPFSEIEPSS